MDLRRVLSFPPYPGDYLHPVVYACTAVMLLCLLISILTYIINHRVIRISRKGWHLLLNFLFHTAVTFGVFAGGINQITYPIVCQVVGMVLHYSSLSTLLWLVFTARNICKAVSKAPPPPQDRAPPTQPRHNAAIFRLYLVSVGVPLTIVGVTAAVSLENYGSRDDAPYCWMAWQPSLGGFHSPAGLLVLVLSIYLLCTHVLLKRHPERRYELKAMTEEQRRLATAEMGPCRAAGAEHGEPGEHACCPAGAASMLANEHSFKAQLRATTFTLLLLLATWAFGALAVSQDHFLDMIFSCLYGACSVTLGLFLLIQHCAKRDDVWHRWWACCPSKPNVEANGEAAGNAAPPTDIQSHTPSHGNTQIHCEAEAPCQPLLSPHLRASSPHCKLGSLPSAQNHTVTCCAALRSPSPMLGGSARPQPLPEELPRPALPLQSCLKDRTKSRSFNRPRPCLRDYTYHVASTSMDGSVPGSHLDSPHSVHLGNSLACRSSHLDSPHSVHLGNSLACRSSHLDSQLSCHSPHPDDQPRCPSPVTSHGLHDSISCHGAHLVGQLPCREGHTCCRHMSCTEADPFSSFCCPRTDSFAGTSQAKDVARTAEKDEDAMLHLDIPPPRSALAASQSTLNRKGNLSRRGTLSRDDSTQEDFAFSPDLTGNIRTGPWKNETTV
ncbi:adhesion G protein-coupled receptor A1 [Brachyhypopomus gauderio]|uniref:adhesion G protein-coupled receptor A1 n=1 Tax=Brachyhypopomus gauderio TaxID=698409 RepID=UPI0040420459